MRTSGAGVDGGLPCAERGLLLALGPWAPLYLLHPLTELLASLAPGPLSILPGPRPWYPQDAALVKRDRWI